MSARPSTRRHPLVALRALGALRKNREDTRQVFIITEALRGKATLRGLARFRRTPVGQAVLRERRRLLDRLNDRTALAALPPGSLGRAYHDFLADENLSAQGLVEASHIGRAGETDDLTLFRERNREMHDLWHVLTGYGRDPLGETCVVAFSYPQTRLLGFVVIALMGMARIARALPGLPVRRTVFEAYRHGRSAAWLPGEDWEALLGEQLDPLRQRLNVKPPVRYQQIVAAERQRRGNNPNTAEPVAATGA